MEVVLVGVVVVYVFWPGYVVDRQGDMDGFEAVKRGVPVEMSAVGSCRGFKVSVEYQISAIPYGTDPCGIAGPELIQ